MDRGNIHTFIIQATLSQRAEKLFLQLKPQGLQFRADLSQT